MSILDYTKEDLKAAQEDYPSVWRWYKENYDLVPEGAFMNYLMASGRIPSKLKDLHDQRATTKC